MKLKNVLITTLFLIILTTTAHAQTFSLNPCGTTTSYESGTPTKLYLENECMLVELQKNPYNPVINFFDKVHNEEFQLHLFGIEERNLDSPFQTNMTPFASMGLTGSIIANKLLYTDGDTTIGYELRGRQLKAFATINNWNYLYPNSELWVETKSKGQGSVTHTPPEVDGDTKPVEVTNRTAGINFFYQQKLGRGNSIVLDPIFQVDYLPVPAVWLAEGTTTDVESTYPIQTDIATNMSDNLTSTFNPTRAYTDTGLLGNNVLIGSYNMDETTGTTMFDQSDNQNNGTHFNSPDITINGITNAGTDYDGVNQYSFVNGTDDLFFNSTDQYLVCLFFNQSVSNTNGNAIIDALDNSLSQGFYLEFQGTNEIKLRTDRSGSGGKNAQTSITWVDSQWHSLCGFGGFTNMSIWVDGKQEAIDGASQSGNMNLSGHGFYVAEDEAMSGNSEIQIDEVCLLKGNFDNNLIQIIQTYNSTQTCMGTFQNQSDAQVISVSFNQTYNPAFNWYLGLNKRTDGNQDITIYAHDDNVTINESQIVETTRTGIGWFYTNVTSLMQYMNETAGLNYSKFRFFSETPANFSDVVLRQEANDTQPPTIFNCTIEDARTNYTCAEEHAHLDCQVTDDLAVDFVYFQVDGVNYTAPQHNGHYAYEFELPAFEGNNSFNWTHTYATDISNLTNFTSINLQFNQSCPVCIEDWVEEAFTCSVGDNYTRTYTDQNTCGTTDNLPADNGTLQTCNYCSQDLQQNLGSCTFQNNQTVDWVDNNQTTCCDVTGIASDCQIQTYPFNTTTQQNCSFYTTDFNCTLDTGAVIDDRINLVCELPDNEEYCCIVKKYQLIGSETTLLDVSPQYRQPTESLLPIWQRETETRECFTPQLRQLNAYYTNKELRPNTDYVVQVTCTSNATSVTSEYLLTPEYKTPDQALHLFTWAKSNIIFLIALLIVTITLVLFIGWVVKNVK